MALPKIEAFATRIVFEGSRAVGVEFMQGGARRVFRARREVLVASGALQSPQLLMVSGIGPAAALQGLGIPVIADLPVGRNLQDHLDVIINPGPPGGGIDIGRPGRPGGGGRGPR